LLLALFFAAQLIFSGLAALLMRIFAREEGRDFARLVTVSLPAGVAASYLLSAGAMYWLLVRRHRLALGPALGLLPFAGWSLWRPFMGGIVLQLLAALLLLFEPPPEDQQIVFEVFLRGGPWSVAFFFVVAVGLAPILEEALFRGLLLPALRWKYGFARAALFVTLLFTALHGFQTGPYWPALLGIFVCGWILAWLRERHGSLWPSIAFHAGFNFTAFIPVLLFGDKVL
jgi:membrane protease YdiL (CAAX protease family)